MIPLQSRPKVSSKFAPLNAKRRNRSRGGVLIGSGVTLAILLLAGTIFAMQQFSSHAAPVRHPFGNNVIATIGGLKKISQVGSTANIVDNHGNKIAVDSNPYKIAMAPASFPGGFSAGDLLVSNFGNTDKGNTIVSFRNQKGPGRLFNQQRGGGLSGPADLIFNMQTNSLWVANSSGNDIVLFNPNGTLLTAIKNPLFKGPWGLATNSANSNNNHRNAQFSFFTANDVDGKILRIDVTSQRQGMPKFKVVQIGQFDRNGDTTFIDLQWLPSLKLNNHTWNDVLLALDPAHSRIAVFANSSSMTGRGKGMTAFQGKPLNMPGGLAINPLNGNLLVVNTGDNNLVELDLTKGKVIGVKQLDPKKVDGEGNGAALFGVLATKDRKGNLEVFFTDDNSNSLNVLSAS
ncbi:MAG TPA: hypothetical protein VGN34_32995 [Ktedonobacteraceae bacterium]